MLITEDYTTLEQLEVMWNSTELIGLSDPVRARIQGCADYVQKIATGGEGLIYGVNTGFGSLCEVRIGDDEISELQHRHLKSHACGVGDPIPAKTSRLVLLVKLHTFRAGRSGITMTVIDRLLEFLNHAVLPVIPKKGTVGASGDLAPLAHMALPVIGLGRLHYQGQIRETADVLEERGWAPIRLKGKEGLALTNGVQYINALACEMLFEARELVRAADLIASLSIQGFSTAKTYYQQIVHETSYHPERQTVAANLRHLLEGSNHFTLPGCNRALEDAYSFRCLPQVHAAVRQTLNFAWTLIEREVNSVSDNPLFFPEVDQTLTCGNLHGESSAFSMDFLAIALSELGNISERRTYQLLSGQHHLPSYLIAVPGLNSGLMIPQYTSAALVNENKVLSTPGSIDTIPTCQLQEDHVSMGGTSAYKLQTVVRNLETILAIELMTAAQAVFLNKGLVLSPLTARFYEDYRRCVAPLTEDRYMAADIEASIQFLRMHRRAWVKEYSLQ